MKFVTTKVPQTGVRSKNAAPVVLLLDKDGNTYDNDARDHGK